MSLEVKIKEYLEVPVKVGDSVRVRGLGSQDKVSMSATTKVLKIDKDLTITINHNRHEQKILKDDYEKCTRNVGYNPMELKPWDSSMQTIKFGLESVLNRIGFNPYECTWNKETIHDTKILETNWNPHIVDNNGEKVYYQRDFCWTINEKRRLLDSIYNNIDIGKFIVRKRSYNYVLNAVKSRNYTDAHFVDIVDGKQRLKAITDFLLDRYDDNNGMKYSDFSLVAKRKFLNYLSLSYGEIGERASDKDVKNVFLGVNFEGVPMSIEHINFVKSINL